MASKYERTRLVIIAIIACVLSGILMGGLVYYYSQVPVTAPELPDLTNHTVTNPAQEIPLATPETPVPTSSTTITIPVTHNKKVKQARTKKSKSSQDTQTKQGDALNATADLNLNAQHASTQSHDPNSVLTNTKNSRIITVHNNITNKMLTYSHWTGRYKPTTFAISINGQTLEQGQTQTIPIRDNRITIFYRYSFMNGYRTGARNITFLVDPSINTLSLTFAWKNKWHILLDHASPEEAEEVSFKK